MATYKENSDGGQGDDGEDALRMEVKTKILCYTAGPAVTLVMRSVLLHSFLLSSNNYKPSHRCQELCEVLGAKGRHALSAENQLDETELDMLTNGGKEKAGSAGEGRGEKDCEETEEVQTQPQPSPAGMLLRLQSS